MNDALKFVFDEANQKKLDQIRKGDSIIFRITSIASADGMQHNALVINKEDTEVIGFADLNSSSIEAKQNSYVPLWNKGDGQESLAHLAPWLVLETRNLCTQPKLRGGENFDLHISRTLANHASGL